MLTAIKHDRKLSLKHWRYRLLHWFFNVDESNCRSRLPGYFYSHYCPLFHFTNLIALFLPIILPVKIVIYLFSVSLQGAAVALNSLDAKIIAWQIKRAEKRKANQEVVEEKPVVQKPKLNIPLLFKQGAACYENIHAVTYDDWLWKLKHNDKYHAYYELRDNREEYEEKFNALKEKLVKIREEKEERRRILRERITFWVNFSSAIIKWLLYGVYAALAVLVVWFLWAFGLNILSCIFWVLGGVFSATVAVPWTLVIKLVGLAFLLIVSCALLVAVNIKFNFLEKILVRLETLIAGVYNTVVAPVVNPVFGAIGALFRGVGNLIVGVIDFTSMFFQENCPKIEIVSEEEAILEEDDE